jgi:2',3'-cyclic-nucleotide 2'-phosphodiesterase (5'-nucleotidase family)
VTGPRAKRYPGCLLVSEPGSQDRDALAGAKPKDVKVQLLGLNDFHGHLEPTRPGTIAPDPASPRVPAGGAEYLATHLRTREAENRNTLILSAGDLIGASPLLSALFHDEPTIEAMNKIGLDLKAVGNHEFDEGAHELLRMQNADFTFARSGAEGDGNVTYGEAFTVQPFGNSLVTLTLTGAQMLELLKQQWCTLEFARVLLPSAGVSYSYSQSAATALLGQPCQEAANPVSNLSIGGVAVDPAATTGSPSILSWPTAATSSPSCARAPTASEARWTPMPSRPTSRRRSRVRRSPRPRLTASTWCLDPAARPGRPSSRPCRAPHRPAASTTNRDRRRRAAWSTGRGGRPDA